MADETILGPGAYGDPANPKQSRAEFEDERDQPANSTSKGHTYGPGGTKPVAPEVPEVPEAPVEVAP